MHPAYSVIFFTTASGAGYGLLVWLAAGALMGLVPESRWFGFGTMALALGLVAGGLLSSTFHLGHPERAWRALTQWRSSWLSREGVMALLTFIPAGWLAAGWILLENLSGLVAAMAALFSILGALGTLWCTGMIYASLRTIRAWSHPLVAPLYVVLGLATGAVLFNLALHLVGHSAAWAAAMAAALLLLALGLKLAYWRILDGDTPAFSTGAATGLGRFGKVRVLDPPHTQANFVMREMGYRVARKHVLKLRRIAIASAFVIPAAALILPAVVEAGAHGRGTSVALALAAAVSAALGIITERWLFFAEARHVAMLFYEDGTDIPAAGPTP